MKENWKKMTYFAFTLPNRPGELARFAGQLNEKGINMLGLWGYAEGEEEPRLSCVPESPDSFRDFARAAGLKPEEGQTFYLIGKDRPGALRETLRKIAELAINVDAIESVAADKTFGCFLWVAQNDVEKLSKVLTK